VGPFAIINSFNKASASSLSVTELVSFKFDAGSLGKSKVQSKPLLEIANVLITDIIQILVIIFVKREKARLSDGAMKAGTARLAYRSSVKRSELGVSIMEVQYLSSQK
jgi:hypothetical protein